MVNATTNTTSSTKSPPPTLKMAPSSSPAPSTTPKVEQPKTEVKKPKMPSFGNMKKQLRYILAGVLVFVLLIAGGIAVYLTQQRQELRQQATTAPCIEAPTAREPGVELINNNQIRLQWNQVADADGYRIFLITEGTAGTHPSGKYIVFNVLDNNANVSETEQFAPIVPDDASTLPPSQIDYTWTIPANDIADLEGYSVSERPYYRFLVYAFQSDTNCSNQAAIGMYTRSGTISPAPSEPPVSITPTTPASEDACTVRFTVTAPSATPTPTATPNPSATPAPSATPTNTPVPTATPTPVIGCNDICVSNADCSSASHICFSVSDTENRCRLESNPTDVNCRSPQPTATHSPVPTYVPATEQPPLPETLPETGPEDWDTWLKAGLAILGIGAALLLML